MVVQNRFEISQSTGYIFAPCNKVGTAHWIHICSKQHFEPCQLTAFSIKTSQLRKPLTMNIQGEVKGAPLYYKLSYVKWKFLGHKMTVRYKVKMNWQALHLL